MPSGGRRRAGKPDRHAGRLPNPTISRRDLLRYTSLLGAAGLIQLRSSEGLFRSIARAQVVSPTVVADAVRPDDMLALKFEFINFNVQGTPAQLVRADQGQAAYVVVHFQPQAIAEKVFFEGEGIFDQSLPTPPIPARLAGPSRLAFLVPFSVDELPLELSAMLDWGELLPSVVPVQQEPEPNTIFSPEIIEPRPHETAIEAPWKLIVSPHQTHEWEHSPAAVERGGRVELWHTRLKLPPRRFDPRDILEEKPFVRAVWTPGFVRTKRPATSSKPFFMPLADEDRWELVRLTSDYKVTNYAPKPVLVDNLMLSALGAWMDVAANFTPFENLDILHWSHKATMARDQFVKVIKRGFLYPYGLQASMVMISERKFNVIDEGAQKGKVGAFLRQRIFLVVREVEKAFTDRELPFTRIKVLTTVTPVLNNPNADPASRVLEGYKGFWARVGNDDFLFNLIGVDHDGQEISFTTPMAFILNSAAVDEKGNPNGFNLAKLFVDHSKGPASRRDRPMSGQRIAYAPSPSGKTAAAAVETNTLDIKGEISGKKPIVPKMRDAKVRLQAVEQIKGAGVDGAEIEYHPAYVAEGFAGNNAASEMYVQLKKRVALDYGSSNSADRSGGVATPNTSIDGLSRSLGPVGPPAEGSPAGTAPPNFNPAAFFKDASILGGIELAEVIKDAIGFDQAPKMENVTIYPGDNPTLTPIRLEASLDWHVDDLKQDPLKIFDPDDDASLTVSARFVTPVNPPGEPTFDIVGDLRNFRVHMIGAPSAFLVLSFNRLSFSSHNGSKPDVDVDLANVEFAGVLSFVNELKKFLKTSGNGFDIAVTPSRIEAGYTLEIPDVKVGVFSLQNMSLSVGFAIPFTGDPVSASFGFARRDSPFLVSYTIFGGGGFLELTVGQNSDGDLGIQLFEAAIEFGGNASIDIGVASGGVHVMAGIYFKMGEEGGCEVALLTGYVRLGGELEVLGIISVSLEFNLGLTYDFVDDELWGQATLVIEVEVLLVSKSVEMTVERRFAGSGDGKAPGACETPSGSVSNALPLSHVPGPGPISFEQLITEDEWVQEYAPAFSSAAFGV